MYVFSHKLAINRVAKILYVYCCVSKRHIQNVAHFNRKLQIFPLIVCVHLSVRSTVN